MLKRLYDKISLRLRYHFDAETRSMALDIALIVAAAVVFTLIAAEVAGR